MHKCTCVYDTNQYYKEVLMKNSFCHIELFSNAPDKAKEFYGSLFDWELKDTPIGPEETYTMIDTGEKPGGGIFTANMPEIPTHWLTYINVEDIEASTKKAQDLGAKLVKEISEIHGMGQFSVIQDPQGAVFALWQPVEKE